MNQRRSKEEEMIGVKRWLLLPLQEKKG